MSDATNNETIHECIGHYDCAFLPWPRERPILALSLLERSRRRAVVAALDVEESNVLR